MASRIGRPFHDAITFRRWLPMAGDGLLFLLYWLISAIVLAVLPGDRLGAVYEALTVVLALALAWGSGLLPAVRRAGRELSARLTGEPLVPPHFRVRVAAWFTARLLTGGLALALILAGLLTCVTLVAAPFDGLVIDLTFGGPRWHPPPGWGPPWLPVTALVVAVAVAYLVAGLGHARDRLTRALLGPTAATRLAAMDRRARILTARDELSQQVHDSVGHALTLNAMQAGAAARLLADRPEFARQMLDAIQATSADALRDLDQVLTRLRNGGAPAAGTDARRTLADLDGLLSSTRATGTTIRAELTGALDELPEQVSHTAYRIVREGLTNVLRHTGPVPVRLAIAIRDGALDLELANPLDPAHSHAGTGSGLAALRERVVALGGTMSAAPHEGQWRIAVRIPWREVE